MPDTRRTSNRKPHLSADLRRIIAAYAMHINHDGYVKLCEPKAVELGFYPSAGNPRWAGHNGKVCYPSQLNADAAATAINALPGSDPVVSYACPRGEHWHHVDAGRRARTTLRVTEAIAAAARRAAGR